MKHLPNTGRWTLLAEVTHMFSDLALRGGRLPSCDGRICTADPELVWERSYEPFDRRS